MIPHSYSSCSSSSSTSISFACALACASVAPDAAASGLALGFDLLRAWLLPALIVAPLLAAVGLWSLSTRRRALRALFDERFARRAEQSVSRSRGVLRVLLAAAAAVLLAVALLGPTRGWSLREARQKGIDLVVCLDTSRSMLARDLRPDRLARAKREVQGLLGELKGNRVALVAFAGDARDVAPLTRDRSALERLLEPLSPDENRAGGTNLAAAIERALALFDGRSGAHEAIVLLTDGEDLEQKGLEAAAKAKERGIRVWVVGVGTAGGGKIPLQASDGREGFLKDADGHEVVTQLAGASLQRLAESTGGDYLSTEQSPTPLEDLYRLRIQRLEARALEQGLLRIPHDRYQWFLLPGLALALTAVLLSERRSARGGAALAGSAARLVALAWPVFAVCAGCAALSATAPLAAQVSAAPSSALHAPPAPHVSSAPAGSSIGSAPSALAAPAAVSAPQAPSAPGAVPAAAVSDASNALPPYEGSSERGLAELVAHVRAGKREEALALSARLLARRGTSELSERTEAEILYATGHALAAADLGDAALQAFNGARVLAGPGELRLWSSYNSGAAVLAVAEKRRADRKAGASGAAQLGAPSASTAPGVPAGAAQGSPASADPQAQRQLEKSAYEQARALLLERLRLARGDADTRANLELAVRRLRELEREEQQEQQQDPNKQDPDKQDSQDKPQDDSSQSQPSSDGKQGDPQSKPDPSKQDPSKKDPSKQDEQGKQDPSKQDPAQQDDASKSKDQQQQDPQSGDPKDDASKDEQKAGQEPKDAPKPQPGTPNEDPNKQPQPGAEPPPGLDPSKLTREELVQLLDRLAEIDKEAQKVRAAVRRSARKPVEKDW